MLYYAPLESNLLEGVGNIKKRKIAIIVIIMLIRILAMKLCTFDNNPSAHLSFRYFKI